MAITPQKNLELISAQEQVKSKKEQMLANLKLEMFKDLKLDEKLVQRKQTMEKVFEARKDQLFPTQIHLLGKIVEIKEQGKYKSLVAQYKKLNTEKPAGFEDALKILDKELAEQIILDQNKMIEFSSTENFDGKTAEQEAKSSFERLEKNEKYTKKIELIKKKNGEETLFVIKRTKKQLEEIERAEKAFAALNIREEIQQQTKNEPIQEPENQQKENAKIREKTQQTENAGDKEPQQEEENNEIGPVELTATISDTTKITRAIAKRQAGEKLRQIYKNITRYKPRSWPTKVALFVGRGYMKDHYTRKFLKMKSGMQRDENLVKGADRHEMEEGNKFNEAIKNVGNVDEANYPRTYAALDTLAKEITGDANTLPPRQKGIADNLFQQQFTAIIRRNLDTTKPATATDPDRKSLAQIVKDNDMEQMSSNVTIKLNAFRDHQEMSWNIADHTTRNPTESDTSFNAYSRAEIVKYFKKYQKNPDFLKTLNIKIDDANAMQELRRLQAHQGALTQIAAQSLKLKVQILAKGEEAYDVKQEGNIMTKIGNRLDKPISDDSRFGRWMEKHPFTKNAFGTLRGITKIGAMITPAILLAPLGPLAIASGAGGMAFTKTLFKKYAHYNKEHIGYQRNQAVNLLQNTAERERLMNEISKMGGFQRTMRYYFGLGKKARDVRQFRDYVMTTHNQLENSNTLNTKMEKLLSKPQLTTQEQQELEKYISEGLARLDHHKKTGQNFLGSKNKDVAEKEYQNIYRLVLTGSMRLDKDLATIRTNNYYDNEMDLIDNGTGDAVDQIGYQKSRKRFKYRQTEKALLGAVKAGGVAFGLSYLASSLASTKAKTDITTNQTQVSDNFVLGKHELATDNNVYTTSKDFFQNPNTAHQTVIFNYGGGTDATHVIPGHLTNAEYLAKVADTEKEILQMTHISTSTKSSLINEIHNKPRETVRAQKGFTNDYLHGMRCIEGIEQTAKALNDSGVNASNITLHAAYSGSTYDIVGTTYNNAGERIIQGTIEYTNTIGTPENIIPIPIPGFMNTFKEPDQTDEQKRNEDNQQTRITRSPAPKTSKQNKNGSDSRRRSGESVEDIQFTNANN